MMAALLAPPILLLATRSWCLAPFPLKSAQSRVVADAPAVKAPQNPKWEDRPWFKGSIHPLEDPVLTKCGYEPLKKVPLIVEHETERFISPWPTRDAWVAQHEPFVPRLSDFAVLASARSPNAWKSLRDSVWIEFDTSADFTPPEPHFLFGTKPHYLLGLFADFDDLYRGDLFVELGRARDRIIQDSRGKANVVACVFFADPDPDESQRLYDSMVRGYDGDLIEEAAEEHNLFFFYGSQLAYEAELDGLKDGAEAAEKERTAAEEKAENVT